MNAIATEMLHLLPHPARIVAITDESEDTRTFVLRLETPVAALDAARPGQFVMLSLLGYGEAAFTLARLPHVDAEPGTVTLTVRRIGALTWALFACDVGAHVGVRGPFGRGFPLDAVDRATVYVAGGCGLVPLRSAIDHQLATRRAGVPIAIVYGARSPAARILRASLAAWRACPGVTLIETVERTDGDAAQRVGTVLDVLDEAVAAVHAERAALCGPTPMLAAVAARLRTMLPSTAIAVALERYMKCGVGLCGHCYVNGRYVCTDGPVFTLAELDLLPEAFGGVGAAHC